MDITWNTDTKNKFDQLIERVPIFLREMARDKISKKAERIVAENQRTEVTEKDLVDAFFAETPFGFHGPMKSDMETVGIDYIQYGYEK